MKDNLYIGEEARPRLLNGIRRTAEAIGQTMGTSGKNSLLEAFERPGFMTTNDGFSIANAIRFEDPLEELGRKILCEAINRANRASGDGSSTTSVLCAAILEQGMKHLEEVSPMELKRELESMIPLIEKSLQKQKKEITVDSVSDVATISSEDRKIGDLIQEIYKKVGKTGIVQWDISKTAEDGYTIGEGLTISGATYASPYMCDVDVSGNFLPIAKFKKPVIVLCKTKIISARDFENLFISLNSKGKKEVILFCDEIEFPAIADLVKTRIEQGFRAVVVKMPVLWKDEWWEDLAKASGATIIDPLIGIKLHEIKEEHTGTFGYITIDRENTTIDGIKDLSAHIADLQAKGEDKGLVRAGRLNTKTARYFVGAHSDSALAYKRLKVEDALNASSLALNGGVVVGGGKALVNTALELPDDSVGGIILREALQAPMFQIINNAGGKIDGTRLYRDTEGFNSKTGKVEDLMEAGVIDPADVCLNAVRSAIGVAASILTIGTVVLLDKEPVAQPQLPMR